MKCPSLPAGIVSFVSKGYGGVSSDRFIFSDSGVISKFSSNSACMVDCGFNVLSYCRK